MSTKATLRVPLIVVVTQLVKAKVIFPCHLRLVEYAKYLPNKPKNIVELAKAVSEKRDVESKNAFVDAVRNFTDWGIDPQLDGSIYVEKMELTWQYSDDNIFEL